MAEDRGGRSAPGGVDALVEEFRGFLGGERGLASETLRCYGNHARAFLTWLPTPLDVAVAELSAGLVTGYVVEYCRGVDRRSG
jgi:integrase/recombinase XerD